MDWERIPPPNDPMDPAQLTEWMSRLATQMAQSTEWIEAIQKAAMNVVQNVDQIKLETIALQARINLYQLVLDHPEMVSPEYLAVIRAHGAAQREWEELSRKVWSNLNK